VTLYCTHDVPNVPEGVEVRPASDIWDIDMTLVDGTSPAFVANVWRCRMIRQTGAIWVDCDAFCHAPFPDEWDYIFGEHGFRGALNNGVLGMPSDSALLDALLDYYENLPDYPPWWNPRQRKKMDRQDAKLPLAERIYKTERTGFGPQALTHFAKETGVFDLRKPHDVLYPVPFQLNDIFYDPHGRVEGWFTDDTVSVHLYTNGTKPWWRKNAPAGELLCLAHGAGHGHPPRGRAGGLMLARADRPRTPEVPLDFDPDRPTGWSPSWHDDVTLVPWGAEEPRGAKRAAGVFDAERRLLEDGHCYRYAGGRITVAPGPGTGRGASRRVLAVRRAVLRAFRPFPV
jgi:hypothetical protein